MCEKLRGRKEFWECSFLEQVLKLLTDILALSPAALASCLPSSSGAEGVTAFIIQTSLAGAVASQAVLSLFTHSLSDTFYESSISAVRLYYCYFYDMRAGVGVFQGG